jgi:hypothetical protein
MYKIDDKYLYETTYLHSLHGFIFWHAGIAGDSGVQECPYVIN